MSLPGRKALSKSTQKKIKRRGKSVEKKQKISFKEESKNETSVLSIIQQTVKQTNQQIAAFIKSNQEKRNAKHLQVKAQEYQNSILVEKKNIETKIQIFNWQIDKIQQKRKLKGLKAKLAWTNGKQNIRVVLRAVLTQNYIRGNESDYFIELDSANVDLKLAQQKQIQKAINSMIQQEQQKSEDKHEIYHWLKSTLINSHNMFSQMKLSEKSKTKEMIQFKKIQINSNYILYPCPASITWSSHGLLCLSQNKVSNIFKPIIGSIHSYRHLVQAPKFKGFDRKNNEIEDLKMVDQRREEEEQVAQAQFYGWDAKQQINFAVFGSKAGDEDEDAYKHNEQLEQNQKLQKKLMTSYESFFMGNTNNFSPRLQKIYKRYFIGYGQNVEFQFLQKLKIFTIKNQITQLQDGILYLIDKIQRNNREGVMQCLLQNQLAGYKNILLKHDKEKNRFFERQKYDLISQFFQQKIKNTPQSQHFLYMKSIMVQNEFFRLALQDYYQQNFKRLKITDKKYQCLGTYDNFDEVNAQKILFQLLQYYLKKTKSDRDSAIKLKNKYKQNPSKYDDQQYKQKKYKRIQQQNEEMKLLLKGYSKKKLRHLPQLPEIQSQLGMRKFSSQNFESHSSQQFIEEVQTQQNQRKEINRNVNFNLMPVLIVNKVQFISFQFNMILTAAQRDDFLKTVIPILWIKDRSSQKFEYKMAKRVIIANSKIISFLQILTNIANAWKKAQGKRNTFLKFIVKQYEKFKCNNDKKIGKNYIAYCQNCHRDFTAYSIQELFRVTFCQRCKYLQQVN